MTFPGPGLSGKSWALHLFRGAMESAAFVCLVPRVLSGQGEQQRAGNLCVSAPAQGKVMGWEGALPPAVDGAGVQQSQRPTRTFYKVNATGETMMGKLDREPWPEGALQSPTPASSRTQFPQIWAHPGNASVLLCSQVAVLPPIQPGSRFALSREWGLGN